MTSDEPKTTKVYLMVECEVENDNCLGTPEERSARFIEHAIFTKCMGMKNKGYRVEMFARMVVQKPVVLPGDIKDILFRDSIKHLPLHQKLREAVVRDDKRPAKERFQDMIDRGVINEKGEVPLGCHGPWEDRDYDE
jgi:hypothetical protein